MNSNLFRRHVLISFACAAASATAATTPSTAPECASGGLSLKPGIEVIEAIRSFTGADGNTQLEKVEIKGTTKSFYNNKTTLTQFDLGDPTKAVIVYGHPNMEIPQHPAPYPEKFLIIAGSSTIELPNGTKYEIKPGTLFISEDTTGTGRSGRSGPCGYVAIDFQYKDAKPK